jgi:hypothetical protein
VSWRRTGREKGSKGERKQAGRRGGWRRTGRVAGWEKGGERTRGEGRRQEGPHRGEIGVQEGTETGRAEGRREAAREEGEEWTAAVKASSEHGRKV